MPLNSERQKSLHDLGIGQTLISEWSIRGIDPTEADLQRLEEAVKACATDNISRRTVELGEVAALRGVSVQSLLEATREIGLPLQRRTYHKDNPGKIYSCSYILDRILWPFYDFYFWLEKRASKVQRPLFGGWLGFIIVASLLAVFILKVVFF